MTHGFKWQKYFLVFLITVGIFLTALYVSNYLNNKKFTELKSIQDKISIDLLSSETQFALLEDLSCTDINNSILSQELGSLADKLDYSENNIGQSDSVRELKKYYSLLEIKDYLLMKKVTARCGIKSQFVLYFYTTSENCSECTKQGYVLTSLHEAYPDLRVYSFDYGLDLSAIQAMISIYKVEDTKLPALVINDKLYTGFKSVEDVEKIVPALAKEKAAKEASDAKAVEESANTATTTKE